MAKPLLLPHRLVGWEWSWVRSARHKASAMLHSFHRISQKARGICSCMAHNLIRCILQPGLVYQAQFQCFTLCDWGRLKTVSQAMCAITGLLCLTPPSNTPGRGSAIHS